MKIFPPSCTFSISLWSWWESSKYGEFTSKSSWLSLLSLFTSGSWCDSFFFDSSRSSYFLWRFKFDSWLWRNNSFNFSCSFFQSTSLDALLLSVKFLITLRSISRSSRESTAGLPTSPSKWSSGMKSFSEPDERYPLLPLSRISIDSFGDLTSSSSEPDDITKLFPPSCFTSCEVSELSSYRRTLGLSLEMSSPLSESSSDDSSWDESLSDESNPWRFKSSLDSDKSDSDFPSSSSEFDSSLLFLSIEDPALLLNSSSICEYHKEPFLLVYFAIMAWTVLGLPLPSPFLRNWISSSFELRIKVSLMVLFLFFLSQIKNFLFSTGCQWIRVSPFLTVVFVGFLFGFVCPSACDFLAFTGFLFSLAGFLFGFFLFNLSSKFEYEDILSFGKDSLVFFEELPGSWDFLKSLGVDSLLKGDKGM